MACVYGTDDVLSGRHSTTSNEYVIGPIACLLSGAKGVAIRLIPCTN